MCKRVTSEDNCSDVNTKAVGPHIFLKHYPTCMGYSIIPRSEQRVKSIKDEGLPSLAVQNHYSNEVVLPSRRSVNVEIILCNV